MYKVKFHTEATLIKVERRDEPTFCLSIEEASDDKPWYHDIKVYLENQEYPTSISNTEKKTLRWLATKFFLNGDVLYKRNHNMVLLICVDKHEADLLIKEIHEGSFSTHANGHAMARKTLRAGYYWLTMESDCFSYARKCHKCQIYVDKVHVPPTPLNGMASPWLFSMWGIDMIGPIEPRASNGH